MAEAGRFNTLLCSFGLAAAFALPLAFLAFFLSALSFALPLVFTLALATFSPLAWLSLSLMDWTMRATSASSSGATAVADPTTGTDFSDWGELPCTDVSDSVDRGDARDCSGGGKANCGGKERAC